MRETSGMFASKLLPRARSCVRCQDVIELPQWAESDENWIHFSWKCSRCGHQFQTAAIYDLLQLTWFERGSVPEAATSEG
jgi:hypothetical protein